MGFKTALVTYVTTDTTISGLIGARLYPALLPQKPTYPCVRYVVVSAPREYDHNGASGLVKARVQFDAYGVTAAQVEAVKEAFRARLSGFKGSMGSVVVGSSQMISERDGYEDSPDVYDSSFDFSIWFKE